MRKIISGLVAAAAIAAPIALAGSASAATTGTGMHFETHYQGSTYVHDATTAYTCDAAGNVNFTFIGNDPGYTGNGSGTITATVVTFTGTRPTDGYSYTIAGDVTGPNGAWTLTASTDSLGQVGASAEGSFIGVPDCAVDAVVPVGNHGEYVSGAAHAGIKGKDLAAIAKDARTPGRFLTQGLIHRTTTAARPASAGRAVLISGRGSTHKHRAPSGSTAGGEHSSHVRPPGWLLASRRQ